MKVSPFEADTGGGGTPPSHPVAGCLDMVEQALAGVAGARCWSLNAAELAELTARAGRVLAGVAELRLRLVAAADAAEVAATNGAVSTASWLSHADRSRRRHAAAEVRLAKALDRTCEATRAALALGRINPAQAAVITATITGLPAGVGDDQRAAAEASLLRDAEEFGPDELRILGRRIFEVIDPDNAERLEGKSLEAEEERARRVSTLWMRRRGDGTTGGSFRLPDAQADMLRTWCEAVSAPRRAHLHSDRSDPDTDAEQDLPYPVRMGRALGALAEHLPVGGFADHGAVSATLTIDIDFDKLRDQVGAAMLSTGTPISASQARRLACNTGLLPLVLDGASRILDAGTTKRLFDRYQKIALAKRDQGCVWPGCDRPPAWTEAHHIAPWSAGGPTDLANGCLLCVIHHHLAHAGEWRLVTAPDGVPDVIPPKRIDPAQRPRRHHRFKHRTGEPMRT